MPAPANLEQQVRTLATAPRGMPRQPFARRNNGKWAHHTDQQREANLAAVWDVVNDLWGLHEDPMPSETRRPEEYYQRPGRMSVNHLRRWVDLWSVTYAEPPVRVFYQNGERLRDGATLDALQDLYRQANVDGVLKQCDADMRLYHNAILRPWWDADHRELVIQLHKAFDVRVVANALNVSRPWATIIMGTEQELGRDGAYETVPVAEAYMPGQWVAFRGSTVVASEPLPYDPLVHCFDRPPTLRDGYWGHALGIALAALNLRLNEDGYSQFFYGLLMQSMGQLVWYGGVPDGDIEFGPGRAIKADPESRIDYITPGADLQSFKDGLDWLASLIREVYGIPKSMLDVQTDASGAAIVQANGPLTELRRARGRTFERIETELLRAIVAVARGNVSGLAAGVDPNDFDVSASYVMPASAQSVTDSIAQEAHDIALGVLTPAEVLMKRHPDRYDSLEEAEAELAARESAKAAAAGGTAVQDTALNGAQVAALRGLVQAVAAKALPAEAAAIVIQQAFPSFSEDEVRALVRSAERAPVPAMATPAPNMQEQVE